jgi:hypothetical protein
VVCAIRLPLTHWLHAACLVLRSFIVESFESSPLSARRAHRGLGCSSLTLSLSLSRCQKHGAFPSRAKALHDEDLVVCTEHVLSLFFAPSHPIPASNSRLNNAMFCYVPMVVAYSPTDMWPPIWLTVAYTLSALRANLPTVRHQLL